RILLDGCEIGSEVRLLVDHSAVVAVGPALGKARSDRGARLLQERAVEERSRRRLAADLAHALLGAPPELAIDEQIALDGIRRRDQAVLRDEIRHLDAEEVVGEHDLLGREALWLDDRRNRDLGPVPG